MSEETKKTYVNGVWIEQKKFDNGNSILKLSVLPDKFIESLKAAEKTDKGYIRLVISRRKEIGKNGETHTMFVDNWKPKTPAKQTNLASKPVEAKPVSSDNDFF